MFRIEVHQIITRINSVFYRLGVWNREDEATVGDMRLKFFYSFYYFLFIISMIAGAHGSADIDEFIFSVEYSFIFTVVLVKLLYIIWRKKEILQLLNRLGLYSIQDEDTFTHVNNKLDILMKFSDAFISLCFLSTFCIVLVIPILGSERKFYYNIGFPLDWENSECAYWIAFIFIFTQANIAFTATLFSAITWYLMTNCGLRYKVLGQQIRTMGKVKSVERIGNANGRKISNTVQNNLYLRDLIECIESHSHLKELTIGLDSFLSELFVAQLTTSALCICCSIYSLAFSKDGISVEYIIYIMTLLYNIFDIFMIMNFGNEIELASDSLTYCLFESEWTDRPQSTKKIVLIFGEFLMKPHQLVVLKLYPLNLETFTRILNSAYSTFNILQNFE